MVDGPKLQDHVRPEICARHYSRVQRKRMSLLDGMTAAGSIARRFPARVSANVRPPRPS